MNCNEFPPRFFKQLHPSRYIKYNTRHHCVLDVTIQLLQNSSVPCEKGDMICMNALLSGRINVPAEANPTACDIIISLKNKERNEQKNSLKNNIFNATRLFQNL